MLIVTSVVLSSSGQTVLKLGLNRLTEQDKANAFSFVRSSLMTWQVWLGLVLFTVSVLVWMRVLASSDLSWGYPMLGLSYVLVALAGWLVFREEFTFQRLAGIALVIAGAVLVGRS
jgi:multidrug transporter EmrE-like cation transporter